MKRPSWHTEVTVRTWARKYEKVSCWRDFEMYDKEGTLIAVATTEWVLIDAVTHNLRKITDEIKKRYGENAKSVFKEEIKRKNETK